MSDQQPFEPDFADPTEWATMYRDHGLQVVPAMSPREDAKQWKRPIIPWRGLENELVPDFTFERWYGDAGEHSRRKNMGLIAGACSNRIFVVDLDIHKNDAAKGWWLEMQDQQTQASQLETVEQVTGGGGLQLFFRAPPDWTPPTCKTSIGVDIRGQGGFAMLPPSMHESGKRYWWKPGHEPWEMEFADAPQWFCDAITDLAQKYGGASGVNRVTGEREVTSSPAHSTNAFGMIIDGREDRMMRVVWAAVVDAKRDCPITLSKADSTALMMEAFGNYERRVKNRLNIPGVSNADLLEREGRGISLFMDKWEAAVEQWDDKVAAAAAEPKPVRPFNGPPPHEVHGYDVDPDTGELTPKSVKPPQGAYEVLNVKSIKDLPDPTYLIDKLVIEQSLGFMYGPPGCGKSFLTIGMALSIAAGQPQWLDHDIKKRGPVIYISCEGVGDMKFRIAAWEKELGVNADDLPFYLIRETINFMNGADVEKLIKTAASVAQHAGQTPVAIFVDTVSRVLPGADENLQKDMTLFISACDILRNTFSCTVVGVHHTSRAGNLRGSTVFDGAGDFLFSIEREEGKSIGKFHAKKIKSAKDGWTQPFELKTVVLNGITGESSLYACACGPQVQATPPYSDDCFDEVIRKIDAGVLDANGEPTGAFFTTSKNSPDRWAGRPIIDCLHCTEKEATKVLEHLIESNALVKFDYHDGHQPRVGLKAAGQKTNAEDVANSNTGPPFSLTA